MYRPTSSPSTNTASLCAGSLTTFSLYGHLFQSRLHYTQYQVNLVAVVAELGLYLFVPVFGYICDRHGPRPASLLSAVFYGVGYVLAAQTYRSGTRAGEGSGKPWPFSVMLAAFGLVGVGTVCIYLAAVTTCAKNFGRGKHKGFALAAPIASFGLGGMWQSQVGSRVLYERLPGSGGARGDVDVFRYFLFLAGLLVGVGIIGTVLLQVVDEEGLIDDAVEELERSGLLEDSEFFHGGAGGGAANGYGTLSSPANDDPETTPTNEAEARQAQDKKTWLLNSETRRFLSDKTMWWLAAGFFLVTGPGEAYLNNLGTIIGTLSPPPSSTPTTRPPPPPTTTPATHVSIIAITSTLARLLSGVLADIFSPPTRSLSRLTLLLTSTVLLSLGLLLPALGLLHSSPSSSAPFFFYLTSALVGTGYGAVFALVPIIVSCVWGVENFGTNWGVVAIVPAGGAAVWSAVYAGVYERGVGRGGGGGGNGNGGAGDGRCYGAKCYQSTFWGMTVAVWVACGLWVYAWRGPGGWRRRGIAV